MERQSRKKLLIDCDPGHDDVLALLLAFHVADVVGITTVSGNAPLAAVTRNALALVELLDVATPVHSGAAAPLAGKAVHATHVHGTGGLGGTHLPEPGVTLAGTDAVDYLLATTREIADCWIVAIGPLTNVAECIRRDPAVVERIAGISLMGGSTTVGNATAKAEFNVWADPEAADIVFRSGARLKMCGLNLTHQVRSHDALIEPLRQRREPVPTLVADILDHLHARMESLTGQRRAALHDPCAVLAVTAPQMLRFEARAVAVELDGTLTRGMTVVDERPRGQPESNNVEVAYHVDADAAMSAILDACS